MTETNYYPLISIIVPVYNVEQYVERCLDSILEQSYPHLEIIVVDDGSTDASGIICDQYAQLDSRIKVFHIENRGLSGARNFGLRQISGDYISFIDSDDFVGINHIENLLVAIKATDARLAITGSKHVPCATQRPKDPILPSQFKTMNPIEALKIALTPSAQIDFNISAWGKLYESSLRPILTFPEGRNFEDIFIMHQVFDNCEQLVYENADDYYYCFDRSGSISKQHDESYLHIIEANRQPFDYALTNLPEVANIAGKRYYATIIKVYSELLLEESKLKDEILKLIVAERGRVLRSNHAYATTKVAYLLSYLGQRTLDKFVRLYSKIL